jgi:putative acetyltransferase
MEARFRHIQKQDNPLLARLIRSVFEEHDAPRTETVYSDPTTDRLYELFKTPKSVLWVAELKHSLAGCCGIYPTKGLDPGYVELVKFYLSKDARGKGIGRELMQSCIVSAIEFGYKWMYLESFPHFAKAVNIYEKLGFHNIPHPLGDSGHKSCTIWMVKDLTL